MCALKTFTRKRLITTILLVCCATFVALVPVSRACAYTHLYYDSTYNCGGSSKYPCLYWQQPSNASVTLYFGIYSSLLSQNTPYGSFNWQTTIDGAFSQYRAVPAWNPYMYSCSAGSSFCDQNSVGSYTTDDGSSLWQCDPVTNNITTGQTTYTSLGPVEYVPGQWYQFIQGVTVQFNHLVKWNTTLTWGGTCATGISADARKVATHESGHVIGMGHTSNAAIMRQGPTNFYLLQSDDLAGIEVVYDGKNPTS